MTTVDDSPTTALTPSQRRRGWAVVGLFVGLVLAGLLFPHSPIEGLILCPIRALTGVECPGCGMTRAVVALVHLELLTSLKHHPGALVLMSALAAIAVHRLAQNIIGRPLRWPGQGLWGRHESRIWASLLIALLVYGLLR